jgi:hypothetical protein
MSTEHRNFFRLDVMMPCSYRILSEEEAKANPLPSKPDPAFIEHYFMENLAELNSQINDLLVQIGNKSALIASALNTLNAKIDFALQTIDQKQLTRTIPQRMVNLSGNGIAIQVDDPIKKTDQVDLLLKPLEDEDPILVRCNVVNIKKLTSCDNCYWVALAYQNISEDDRRKLIYFIQQKEIEMANKERQNHHKN